MGETKLTPGFRFRPTDVELVKYYLKRKVLGKKLHFQGILELDVYRHAPWDLPDKSAWRSGDLKWYFFCPREKRYATGWWLCRSNDIGYWKATGMDRPVSYNHEVVGMKKTLVFYIGKAPMGNRTDWVMHEYRLKEKKLAENGVVQDAYVLCAILKKHGPGPTNGVQYEEPFREEDWDDDDNKGEEVDGRQAVLSADMFAPAFVMPVSQNCSVPLSSMFSEITGETLMASCPMAVASAPNWPPLVSDNAAATLETGQPMHGDEIVAMLSGFSKEGVPLPLESNKNEIRDRI